MEWNCWLGNVSTKVQHLAGQMLGRGKPKQWPWTLPAEGKLLPGSWRAGSHFPCWSPLGFWELPQFGTVTILNTRAKQGKICWDFSSGKNGIFLEKMMKSVKISPLLVLWPALNFTLALVKVPEQAAHSLQDLQLSFPWIKMGNLCPHASSHSTAIPLWFLLSQQWEVLPLERSYSLWDHGDETRVPCTRVLLVWQLGLSSLNFKPGSSTFCLRVWVLWALLSRI